ncbi:response regulator [Ferrimonas lipolytica]|uniref:histidine kinase n=1 Tax=Ferrimonas lipolytica TaxID=2724191 RepID=A0A6H1UIV6_9GAMM|nr:response regulator [Ferrimonas lipolytica]QIZ78758.1 response regulator [Ferrimonas lipolytica]
MSFGHGSAFATEQRPSAAHELSAIQIQNITSELKYLDEVLTSSVLSYAFTSDKKWLNRYNQFEPQLTSLIDDLLTTQQEQDRDLILEFNRVNDALVQLELEAIAAANASQKSRAIALLSSDNYQQLKQQYMQLLLQFSEVLTQRAATTRAVNELKLNEDEISWLKDRTVTVGIEHWPPILFVRNDGSIGGLAGAILNQVVAKTGIKVEVIQSDWNDLLTRFNDGEIDLIPHAYFRQERTEFGDFSSAYYLIRELFFVKDSNGRLKNNTDLANGTVAVVKGYATIAKVQALYPNLNVIQTVNLAESIDLVLSGKVDALIDAELIVKDMLKTREIDGLRMIDEDVITASSLHLYTNKRLPILHSVLQKSLDSLQLKDLMLTKNDWLKSDVKPEENNQLKELMGSIWLIIGSVVLLLLIVVAVGSTVLKVSDKELAQKFGSNSFKRTIVIGLVALSTVLIIAATMLTNYAERQTHSSIEYSLNTLLTSTHQRMSVWVDYELNSLERVGNNRELVSLVERLLRTPRDHDSLVASPLQAQIRQFFAEREREPGSFGFFVISPDKVSISSRRDDNIGDINVIDQTRSELLEQVLAGKSVFIPPLRSDVFFDDVSASTQKQKPPTMFFAAPLVDNSGRIIAIITKRVDFDGVFSNILSAGFIGHSGETYAVDRNGILMSNVRFENQLRQLGLIDPEQHASLNVRVADPGQNLVVKGGVSEADASWPLTYMAQQISQKNSGNSLDGYRDYRGVQVVGSWLWDDLLGVGLVAEIDVEESFALLNIFKVALWSILFFSLILILGSTLFTLNIGTRATQALTRSHNDLERLVKGRTDELRVSMERTRTIIDNASDGIIVVDENGVIQEFSSAAEVIFGYRTEEIIGQNARALMNQSFHDHYLREQVQDNPEQVLYELIGIHKNGHSIDIEVAVGQTEIGDEQIFTGIVRDATLRKEAERELLSAKQKAEEATKAKSDFLANMSHEIRTPMNAIIGMSYLALQTKLSRKQEDYVNKIHTSADALLGIINDILDFSKIEAGKLELEHTPFSLNDTIDHLVQVIVHKAQQKEVELLVDIDPELPTNLLGDPLRLGQILINLANNAIKFTDEGEIIVKAELLEQQGEQVLVQFSVKDSGIGMSEEQVSRLFQSFSQADASTTRKYGGTGLGLTISKTLSELMGGEIWVESTLGAGSTFLFTARMGWTTEGNGSQQASVHSLLDMPVLIVDDSIAAREILFNLVESLGFKPDLAPSGAEALEKIVQAEQAEKPFELVLADWNMPNMDGIELGAKIGENELIKHKPKFVIVTAYDRDDMIKRASHITLDSSITKPVSASTLLDTVMTVMGKGGGKRRTSIAGKIDFSKAEGLAGANILLVEDNEINQEIAIELLNMAGINVSAAWNGQEAVEMVAAGQFDAVLMDVQMPVMDGYEATKLIRQEPKNSELPIIAMTANAMSGDREKCIACGMNDHLSKPINPNEVYKALTQWIEPTGQPLPAQVGIESIEVEQESIELVDIDVEAALARMGGSVKAYVRTLTKVIDNEADAITRVRAALEAGDLNQAVLSIHTLRGVAGNIGAMLLVPPAEQLEQQLIKQQQGAAITAEQHEPLLLQCEQLLQQMLLSIQAGLEQRQSQSSSVGDPLQQQRFLGLLKQQIEDFDSALGDSWAEFVELSGTDVSAVLVSQMSKAVDGYDFDEAEVLLAQIQTELGEAELSNAATLTAEQLLVRLEPIAEQLSMFDSTVVDQLDDLLELPLQIDHLERLEALRKPISEYDFDRAEQQLNEIIEQLQQTEL